MSSNPDPSSSLVEARDTAALLLAVAERTRQEFERAAASLDLTPTQARALLTLAAATPMRAMAGALHCDASNVTGIADRLSARGLVTREPDPGDRRVKLLALTAEGKRVREQLARTVAEASPVLVGLEADERATLRELLGRVLDAVAEAEAQEG